MATFFLDTSALVRRYDSTEPGSQRIRALCTPSAGNTLVVARLASVQVASALGRKTRDGTLNLSARQRLWQLFQGHWR
jgi:predicted nucleic acid-binding protein